MPDVNAIKNIFYKDRVNAAGEKETPHIFDANGIKVFFVMYCRVCGYGLCGNITCATGIHKKENLIFVDPCPVCMNETHQETDLDIVG